MLQKKNVIFLHWFHHVTVLLYVWHAYQHDTSTSLWFSSMNYSVHSIMYLYFFLMSIGVRSATRAVAPLITIAQTTQMAVGMAVTLSGVYYYQEDPKTCGVQMTNSLYGFVMYFCYFVLFAKLFRDSKGTRGKVGVRP